MTHPHRQIAIRAAWRIFPLGIVMGTALLIPVLYLIVQAIEETGIGRGKGLLFAVFLVGFVCLAVLLVFLWLAAWATEESESPDEG